MRCETPEQVADCIRTLAVRGAPAIGLAAAYGMALAERRRRRRPRQLLRETRPTAVNLGWALDRALAADDPLAFAQQLHRDQLDGRPPHGRAGRGALRGGRPRAHALQHGRACDRRVRHRGRRAARRVGARTPRAGVGGRDAPSTTRGAPHRVGARPRRHPLPRGRRLRRGRADGARPRRPRGRRRRPHRRQRRRRQQGRHLSARGAGGAPRRPVLRRGAGVDDRPAHARAAPRSRSRSATPPR